MIFKNFLKLFFIVDFENCRLRTVGPISPVSEEALTSEDSRRYSSTSASTSLNNVRPSHPKPTNLLLRTKVSVPLHHFCSFSITYTLQRHCTIFNNELWHRRHLAPYKSKMLIIIYLSPFIQISLLRIFTHGHSCEVYFLRYASKV